MEQSTLKGLTQMESQTMQQATKVFKSNLLEKTKEFVLFVIAQLTALDIANHEKLSVNVKKGGIEKLKEWHENGAIYYEMPIKDGKRNGLFQMWQPDGRLMCEIPFENGKINGFAILRKVDGDEKVMFKDDMPILLDSQIK
jgi:antitoxin component YwqK of YwqJK toxin-antitoxin module